MWMQHKDVGSLMNIWTSHKGSRAALHLSWEFPNWIIVSSSAANSAQVKEKRFLYIYFYIFNSYFFLFLILTHKMLQHKKQFPVKKHFPLLSGSSLQKT